ncbi:MAG: translation initiation factor IF-2 N-terminal domain-containing protein, partial [Chloroflexota bacterium]|nr:translation initiation factor IF-2 N-terminal domain-containing protein [Chloroflexota bacterium]
MKRTAPVIREPVTLPPVMSVAELADKIQTSGIEVIRELMKLGIMANLNQQVDYETAARVATELGWETNPQDGEVAPSGSDFASRRLENDADPDSSTRPPVITIMGHV